MTIYQYIRTYGKYTLKEKEFNEVDNVIFSCLSYLDFECQNKTLEEAAAIYFKKNPNKGIKYNIAALRNAIRVLENCIKENRYKNIKIMNYKKVYTKKTQFQAVSFLLDTDLVYVSFSGTNHLISGWEEDFVMAYRFPVEAQRLAIYYLNKNYLFSNQKLIIGGHSKGGNLAIISAMYTMSFIRKKIIKIYSNDGLGITKEQLESTNYQKIKDRVVKIIPDYSVVGLILFSDSYKVIQSTNKSILSHNPNSWKVDKDHFVDKNLSNFSKIVGKSFEVWLDKYNKEEKKKFIECLFDVFRKLEIESLNDFKQKKRLVFNMILESRNVDNIVKQMLKDLVDTIGKCYLEYRKDQRTRKNENDILL